MTCCKEPMQHKKVNGLDYYKCNICGKYIDAELDMSFISTSLKCESYQIGSASFFKEEE